MATATVDLENPMPTQRSSHRIEWARHMKMYPFEAIYYLFPYLYNTILLELQDDVVKAENELKAFDETAGVDTTNAPTTANTSTSTPGLQIPQSPRNLQHAQNTQSSRHAQGPQRPQDTKESQGTENSQSPQSPRTRKEIITEAGNTLQKFTTTFLQYKKLMKYGSVNQKDFDGLRDWKQTDCEERAQYAYDDMDLLYVSSGSHKRWEFAGVPSRPETDIITLWIAELFARTIYRHRSRGTTLGGNESILVDWVHAYKISSMVCMSVVSIICLITTISLGHVDNGWLRLVIMGVLDILLCFWAVFAGRTDLFMLILTNSAMQITLLNYPYKPSSF